MSQSSKKVEDGSETLWHLLSVLFDEHALIREISPGEYEIAVAPAREEAAKRSRHGRLVIDQAGTAAPLG